MNFEWDDQKNQDNIKEARQCIMTVKENLKQGQKPSPEQIAEIEAAAKRPIYYDDDAPALTAKMRDAFQHAIEERKKGVAATV